MTAEDVALLEQQAMREARRSFWAYRQYINPKMKIGWWQREVSKELQNFYESWVAGERPKLVIEAPPQHGKSRMVVEFITWVAGKDPDSKAIYTSYSDRLGIKANLMCQRIYSTPKYQRLFPATKISLTGMSAEDKQLATRSREIIEYMGCEGSFRNTTVRGSITGESLDLGIIDDPIKGREEAGSKTVRDKVWDWFTDDFFTRFSEEAGLLAIMTRWHLDDPIGRLRSKFGDSVRVVSYPAIAVKDEPNRKEGEPLFPEHKSLRFLIERKEIMAAVDWEALYQQNPQIVGGEIIHGENFKFYKEPPILKYRNIYADTAMKTKERNDFSVLEHWGLGEDGKVYLLDIARGKWEAPMLEKMTKAFWAKQAALDAVRFGQLRKLKVEDKASGTGLIQTLRSKALMPIEAIERDKDKYTRVMDILGYIESGYVMLPEGAPWVMDFIAECEAFTADDSHLHDDQIDPMCDAINDMLVGNKTSVWEKII